MEEETNRQIASSRTACAGRANGWASDRLRDCSGACRHRLIGSTESRVAMLGVLAVPDMPVVSMELTLDGRDWPWRRRSSER